MSPPLTDEERRRLRELHQPIVWEATVAGPKGPMRGTMCRCCEEDWKDGCSVARLIAEVERLNSLLMSASAALADEAVIREINKELTTEVERLRKVEGVYDGMIRNIQEDLRRQGILPVVTDSEARKG